MTLGVETATNVLGDKIQFFTPWPSDSAQNYHLDPKYLTRDCGTCRFNVPKERTGEIIQTAVRHTPYEWTPPEELSVRGICNWGKCLKILVDRPRGARRCSLVGVNP